MQRLIAAIAALLTALCLATGALAHATLVSAEPADGSVLTQPPKTLQLRFNEIVTPAVIGLIDAAGKTREVTARAAGQMIVIALPDDLPQGTQVATYRVVSQDGHPVAGSLMFSIGMVTGAAPSGKAITPGSVMLPVLIWLFRVGVYLGLFVGVGGVFFAAWIGWSGSGERAIIPSLRIGLVSAVASLGLQGLDLLNLPLSGLLSLAPWQSAFGTSLSSSLLIAIVSMGLARIGWQSPSMGSAWRRTAAAMAGVGLSLAVSGHAATAPPEWVTGPAVFVHGVAVAFWVGALAPLLAVGRKKNGELLPVLLRFSRFALPVVGVLVLTGVGLAIVQLGSFGALIGTSYGIILLLKLVLVAILLGLAALNRWVFLPEMQANRSDRDPLLGMLVLELLAVLVILGLVAGWRFTTPPRALAAAQAASVPLAIHIHTETAMFQVLISPGKVGSDDFVLQLMAGDASPLVAKEATLTLSLPERGIEPIERKAVLGPDGYWHVRGVPMPFPGRWHLKIDALVTDFEKVTLEDDVEVR